MSTITFGEGLGQGQWHGLATSKATSRGYAPGEIEAEIIDPLEEDMISAIQWRCSSTGMTAKQAETHERREMKVLTQRVESLRERTVRGKPERKDFDTDGGYEAAVAGWERIQEDMDELTKYVKAYRRKNGSMKAQVTRAANKARKEAEAKKLAEKKDQHFLLEGSRWVRLNWVRGDWKKRVKVFAAETEVYEVLVVDYEIPIAYARVRVFEDGEGEHSAKAAKIAEPKWKMDQWGRRYHISSTTEEKCYQTVGGIAFGDPRPPTVESVMQHFVHGVDDSRWWQGSKMRRSA